MHRRRQDLLVITSVLLVLAYLVEPRWIFGDEDRAGSLEGLRDTDGYVTALALREAEQVQATARALLLASLGNVKEEKLLPICDSTLNGLRKVSVPQLRHYADGRSDNPTAADMLEALARFQQASVAEMEAVAALLESGGAADKTQAVLAADEICTQTKKAFAGKWAPVLAAAARRQQSDAAPPLPPKAVTLNEREESTRTASPPRANPLTWEKLLEMTGPEGPNTRYLRTDKGTLRRVEARYGGDLLVAVTEVDDGFRITLGNDLAIADFASRPWFTPQERDGLIDAYSEFAAKAAGGDKPRSVGRFRAVFGEDPEFRIKKSVLLTPAE